MFAKFKWKDQINGVLDGVKSIISEILLTGESKGLKSLTGRLLGDGKGKGLKGLIYYKLSQIDDKLHIDLNVSLLFGIF